MNDRDQPKDRLSDESVTDGDQRLVGEEAFQKAYKGHGAVMYVVDMATFSIVDANEAALKFYGYDHATMLTKRIPDLNMTPELEIRTEIKQAVAEGRSYYIFKHRLSSGELRDVEIYANPISIQGKDYSFSIVHDITERKKMENELKRLAKFDNLTQIPNRQLFSEHLRYAIAQAKRHNNRLALLFIDLDKFKEINDNYGHNAGDLLLKAVATRIQQQIRESDSIGRIGGDEFLVLLSNIENVDNAMDIAEKICSAVDQPFDIPGYPDLKISSSMGVAICPDHGSNDEQLMKLADDAMYKVKEGGRNSVHLFQPA